MKRTLISGLVLAAMTATTAVAAPLDGKGNDVIIIPVHDGYGEPSETLIGGPQSTVERGFEGLGQDMDPY